MTALLEMQMGLHGDTKMDHDALTAAKQHEVLTAPMVVSALGDHLN